MHQDGIEKNDPLLLSGLQHFVFCRRQWALIHIEQQWAENVRTVDGQLFHRRAHDGESMESRGDVLITRGMRVFSENLGVTGVCDVVEFHKNEKGIHLSGREGLWTVYPIEYKKGTSKEIDADRLQLCGQALCLEEMLECAIPEGSLFYGETRRREIVDFSPSLRSQVKEMLSEMRQLMARGYTPKVKPSKSCNACSLSEICLPRMSRAGSVQAYLRKHSEDADL